MSNRIRPNFLIIGAAKAGTTYLAGLLDQHPEIAISKPKEPKFFTTYWSHGWEYYTRCFEHASGAPLLGDASTQYSILGVYPQALDRIANYLPDAKIIYLVRDPLARIESQWIEDARSWNDVPVSFEESVRMNREYIDATLYWKQYSAYREFFGESKILVIFFEHFVAQPLETLERCCQFLGVQQTFSPNLNAAQRNSSSGKRRPRSGWRVIHQIAPYKVRSLIPAFPKPILELGKWLFKSKIERPCWSSDLKKWTLDRVREDAENILQRFAFQNRRMWDLTGDDCHTPR